MKKRKYGNEKNSLTEISCGIVDNLKRDERFLNCCLEVKMFAGG